MTSQDNRSKAAADLRKRAEVLARERADGAPEDSADLSPEETRKTIHELRVHKIELEIQNKELRENERKYRELVEGLNEAAYRMMIPEGRYEFFSSSAKDVFGYTSDEFINNPLLIQSIIHPDFAVYFQDKWKELLAGNVQETYEYKIIDPEGNERWIVQSNKARLDDSGQIKGIEGLCRDITGRKQAEEKLRQSEENLRITLNSIGDAVISSNCDGQVVSMNPVAEALTGWAENEAAGKPLNDIFKIINEHTRQRVENPVDNVLKNGQIVGLANHTLLISKDGRETSIADSGAPIRNAKGETTGVVLVFRDQTNERAAQLALERSQQRLEGMFRAAPVGIGLVRERVIMEANERLYQMTGYSAEELIGQNARILYPSQEEYEQVGVEKYRQIQENGTGSVETVWQRKDGARINVLLSSSSLDPTYPLKNEVTFTALDITARKQAEEKLRQSEERFRNYFENLSAGSCIDEIVYKDGRAVDYRILDVNRTYERIMGISREKAVGVLGSQVYGEKKAPFLDKFVRVAETGQPEHFEALFEPINRHLDFTVSQLAQGIISTVFIDITNRKQAESELRRLSAAIEQSPETVVITDTEATIQYVNPAFETTTGYISEEAIGQNPRILKSGKQDAEFYTAMWNTLLDGRVWEGRMINKRKDGSLYTEEASIAPVKDSNGKITNYVGVKRDITAELEREDMFRQAQKMESVGRLAGGVAHDLNNMLMGIMGYTDMCRDEIGADHAMREWLDEVTREAKRSADLTRQLLAFARKQTIAPKVLDLNHAVADMLKMLRRLIGEDIDLSWEPGAELWPVKLDPGQIDQILANLCVNARDAIGGVGKVTIETRNVSIDANYCAEHIEATPGPCVMLAVSDDGCGMDKETLAQVFEPFFTTKGVGEGTGLGLATVYGIVKQNAGFINIYSEPGKGTTIRIYFPCCGKQETMEAPAANMAAMPYAGSETVLVVEDEKAIRKTLKRFLDKLGYTTFAAADPEEALRLVADQEDTIDLLITDVVMPGMSGRELAEKLVPNHPNMKILYMSGYTANVIAHRGILEDNVEFMSKPFRREEIAQKMREMLKGKE